MRVIIIEGCMSLSLTHKMEVWYTHKPLILIKPLLLLKVSFLLVYQMAM